MLQLLLYGILNEVVKRLRVKRRKINFLIIAVKIGAMWLTENN